MNFRLKVFPMKSIFYLLLIDFFFPPRRDELSSQTETSPECQVFVWWAGSGQGFTAEIQAGGPH